MSSTKRLYQVACYLPIDLRSALRALSAKTRIPQQTLLREAVSDLVAKHVNAEKTAARRLVQKLLESEQA